MTNRALSAGFAALIVYAVCSPTAGPQSLDAGGSRTGPPHVPRGVIDPSLPALFNRLPADALPVTAPSARVEGDPGRMRILDGSCRVQAPADVRRRIVDIAVQEWAFFGFNVMDQTNLDAADPRDRRSRRRGPRLSPWEAARAAGSIAGYWSITGEGGWIIERQNAIWNGPSGVAARWRYPWSAAFISWVMCEGGFGESSQFRRAIAHHSYIDQAIEARRNDRSRAAYVAHDVGESALEPGDLVCSARRSAYRSIADREAHLGNGIRSHCDIVIKVDEPNDRILVIGGNVRGAVRLKLLAARFDRPPGAAPAVRSVGLGSRTIFAHLKLRADSIEADAFDNTPTLRALSAQGGDLSWLQHRLDGQRAQGCCRAEASDGLFQRRYSAR